MISGLHVIKYFLHLVKLVNSIGFSIDGVVQLKY